MEHNDYDYYCVKWFGDRMPNRNRSWKSNLLPGSWMIWKTTPLTHREMNGSVVSLRHQRCLICNPYNEAEEELALGWR